MSKNQNQDSQERPTNCGAHRLGRFVEIVIGIVIVSAVGFIVGISLMP